MNWRQIYGDKAFILRPPVYWSEELARKKLKQVDATDLERRAKDFAKVRASCHGRAQICPLPAFFRPHGLPSRGLQSVNKTNALSCGTLTVHPMVACMHAPDGGMHACMHRHVHACLHALDGGAAVTPVPLHAFMQTQAERLGLNYDAIQKTAEELNAQDPAETIKMAPPPGEWIPG